MAPETSENTELSSRLDRERLSGPAELLGRAVESGRVHSAYLLSGAGAAPRETARAFARALVCETPADAPCERCRACRLSAGDPDTPEIRIDGTGKSGPLHRHVGDHPDLLWTEREDGATRVRIGQVRSIQKKLQLGANEGGFRVAVIADAEWLNIEAQNALLRLLEEPPPRTTLVLAVANASALLATIRSRCQRVRFPAGERLRLRGEGRDDGVGILVDRFDDIARRAVPDLLDWAEEYRGARAEAAEKVTTLLTVGSEWLNDRVRSDAHAGRGGARPLLDAFKTLSECRRDLAQRNANPQMVAERALLAVRGAVA